MKVKMNRNAAKVITRELAKEENEGKMVRVFISLDHGDHVHYDVKYDTPTENDVVVETDKGVQVILEKDNQWLDGVWIQYFFVPKEGFVVTNPSKEQHHHHH